jgi:hypothetical protein
MPGIRLFDVRAALAALGLAMLAALAVAVVTHLPVPAASGPATHMSDTGLSRLQSLPLQAQSVISSTIAADSRAFTARRTASGWGLSGGGVRADFRGGEPTLTAGGSALSLSLTGVPGPTSVTGHGNRITLTRSGIREWYAAGPLGIEQGFTLARRPVALTRGNTLTLTLGVGGSLQARAAGSDVSFVGARGDIVARYGGLSAVDARGRHLPGTLGVSHGRVLLSVDDRGARYPITIDPIIQQGAKLVPNDFITNGADSSVGKSVALSSDGNTAIIGAFEDDSNVGAAFVYTRSNGAWGEVQKIVPADEAVGGGAAFGRSVALSANGSTAVIGGPMDHVDGGNGAAWVYVRSGSTYIEQQKLSATGANPSGSDNFGASVGLSSGGNTAIVGGPNNPGVSTSNAGAAWIFARSGSTWAMMGGRIAPAVAGANNPSLFGTAVAMSPDGLHAFIGGPADNAGDGSVWVYNRGTPWTAQMPGPLTASGASGHPQLGSSIALSANGTTAIFGGTGDAAGSGGAAFVFTGSGALWTQQAKLDTNVGNGAFGSAVALSADGKTALIGDPGTISSVGTAFLFARTQSVWTRQQVLSGGGELGFGFFGTSVALASDGQTGMVGAPADNQRIGAAFAFAPPAPVCSSVAATAPQGGGSVIVSLLCTLPFGAHPSFSILGGPSNGTVSGFNTGTGQLTYTSAKFFSGQDSFTYRVNDQWGISNIATATLTTPFLPVPKCSNVTARGKRGATRVTITLKCTGPKGHRFTYGIVSKPGNGRLSKIKQSNGKVTYSTHVGFSGSDRFVYNATDSGGSSKAATATIVLPRLGRITSTMTWPENFGAGATSTLIPDLIVKNLPGGAKVKLSCSKGCPIKARTLALAKHRVCKGKGRKRKCRMAPPKTGNLDLGRYVEHRRVKVGDQIKVAMIQVGSIGKEYAFRMIKNNQPSVKIQTLAPGSTRLCPNC